jgi:transcriptional regulator with XRE-family HTH domain
VDISWDTPNDIAIRIANKIKRIRKRKKITQEMLAARSNVSYASLRRFERTGEISFVSFIKICMELGLEDELNELFARPVYNSIEEVIRDAREIP